MVLIITLYQKLKIKKQVIYLYMQEEKIITKLLKSKLKNIARFISNNSDIKVKVFVDTAPIMEKPLAELSNIGMDRKTY